MKKIIQILPLLMFTFFSFPQAPNWSWARTAGGSNWDDANAMVTDANGNIYITGAFVSQSITFGSIVLNNNNVGSPTDDIFVVKYSPSGNVIWAKSFGGVSDDHSTCISIDVNANIIISGYFFSPSLVFGNTTLNTNATNISSDLFVAKLDSSGNVQWAKSAGGTNGDGAKAITTDNIGNIYITGGFDSQTISFGSVSLTSPGAGHSVFFIVKYDSNGNAIWGKSAGGISTDFGSGIVTDPAGNIIVTGSFISPSITFGSTTVISSGLYDSFTVKYDNLGNEIWVKRFGGTGSDHSVKVCSDINSNIYLTGHFQSDTLVFGTSILINASNPGFTSDVFVIKYNSSGNLIWAKSAGNTGEERAVSLEADGSGNVVVIGWFRNSINFGSTTLIASGPNDIFITKYDQSGNEVWAKNNGCDDYIDGNDILISNQGEIYITGNYYCDTIYFGNDLLVNTSQAYRSDIFLAKLENVVGISELSPSKGLIVHPNPFEYKTTIEFESEQNNLTIKLIDAFGKVIKKIDFSGKKYVLEKNAMQSGVYYLQVMGEQNIIDNKKVIIL